MTPEAVISWFSAAIFLDTNIVTRRFAATPEAAPLGDPLFLDRRELSLLGLGSQDLRVLSRCSHFGVETLQGRLRRWHGAGRPRTQLACLVFTDSLGDWRHLVSM